MQPFEGEWALPGGFIHHGESLEAALSGNCRTETGVRNVYLEQLYSFGDPNATRAGA